MILPTDNRLRLPAAFAVALILLLGFSAVAGTKLILAPGDMAPRIKARDLEGRRVQLDWTGSRATVVNFWASWCEPCRREMPALDELYRRKSVDGLSVIGIYVTDLEDDARDFVQELGITYPILRGERDAMDAWGGVGVLPTSYLVAGDGTIVRRYVGATQEQIDGLIDDVESLLDGKPLSRQVIPDEPDVATGPGS